ncbi:MAG TPA: hypothetical protein PKB09_02710 [Candidatus Saccharibacteria bacterium]|nr:hypothetical protein [Candidatus Saccharibacteria bacterium]
MSSYKKLIAVHFFNGIVGVLGGIGLITDSVKLPESTLAHSGFPSLYFPGVILLAAVGGISLLAGIALYKKVIGAELASILAGLIVMIWIIGEIASIRELHPLQIVFLITGATAIALTPKAKH